MPELSDEELLRGVSQRDEQAFRTLYRRHTAAMYAVALRLLGRSRADAEDAVQEAWLRALRGLHAFRRESALSTWLVGIAIRCALEMGRRRSVGAANPSAHAEDMQAVSPFPPPIDLENAIATLADGYRHVLILHDIYGYTHAEISELLGINEGTSKSQLSRARGLIRTYLSRTSKERTPGS